MYLCLCLLIIPLLPLDFDALEWVYLAALHCLRLALLLLLPRLFLLGALLLEGTAGEQGILGCGLLCELQVLGDVGHNASNLRFRLLVHAARGPLEHVEVLGFGLPVEL
eukprot:GEZU01013292.1.p1 GENE.GEZU01013292.1~~GEZU01013292.1.p1  ORF type:complete len:109 (+),score=7.19 GEZU01013292.1:92-418(+)